MNQFIAEIRKIPPVTRFLCASSLGVTIPTLMGVFSPYKIIFEPQLVIRKFEVWRLYTSFFLGSRGLNYIFELVMLYRTADQLESGPFSRRLADFVWQLILVGGSIILACLPIGGYVFARPLLVALVYLSSSLAPPGTQSSLMGLVTFPVIYLPYVMIGMDLLIAGPGAAAQAIAGAIVGHFWWWTMWAPDERGRRPRLEWLGRAPRLFRLYIGEEGNGPRGGGGVEVIPPRRPTTGSSTGYNWGAGRRLGN
ncbi:hypothetical protein APHAL10511_004133 [Amanita phalloides]|nr:hypothetical protein APHAL10511_004133 [Amanita phalloides]